MGRCSLFLTLLILTACARVSAPLGALASDSVALVAWGSDAFGQTTVPELPAGLYYTQVAAGAVHSLALRSDGQIVGWGNYDDLEIPELPQGLRYTAVAAGGQGRGVALRSDGSVVSWTAYGQEDVPALPAGLRYTAVGAGSNHDLALRSDGQILAWGDNSYGQTSVPELPQGLRYTAVAAGGAHSLALRSDGQIVGWGANDDGQAAVPPLPASMTYRAVAAGLDFSLALRSDGQIVAWGDASGGQLTVPPMAAGERYTSLAAGAAHALALKERVQHYRADTVGAPLGQTLWRVQVGKGVSYLGSDAPNLSPVTVAGLRYSGGKLLAGNAARVVGGKFTLVRPGTNTPNAAGGSLSFTFPSSFGAGSGKVALESLQVTGVTRGAYILLRADGRVLRRLELDPAKGKTQTVRPAQGGVQELAVVVPAAFSLDDIHFSD